MLKRLESEAAEMRLQREHEVEEKRLKMEVEERRLEKEMEEKRLEREMKEKGFEKELEAKLQSEKLATQLEHEVLQLERAKVKRENMEARAEVQSADSSQTGQENVAGVTKTPLLTGFVDAKNNLDIYLLRFERYAIIAGWWRHTWTIWLSPLFTGEALDVHSGLSSKDARDCDKL